MNHRDPQQSSPHAGQAALVGALLVASALTQLAYVYLNLAAR